MATASTQAYIDMLYRVESALSCMQNVYTFDIYRTSQKYLAIEVRLHKQPTIPEAFLSLTHDMKALANMAVSVQNFPGAYVQVRYVDGSRVPDMSDVTIYAQRQGMSQCDPHVASSFLAETTVY